MKKSWIVLLIAVGGVFSLLEPVAQTHAASGEPASGQTVPAAASGLGLYKPPLLGAPRMRVGGGVRGVEVSDGPGVRVLAPLQIGLTIMAQPVLYWHLDQPTPHAMEITVMEVGGVTPLVRESLAGPVAAGLHAFRLAGQNKRLEIGKEYEWFVAVILDPAQRSKDSVASGGLARIAVPIGLPGQLNGARTGEAGLIYARAGLWYDAINALVEGAAGTRDKKVLAGQFTAILQQEEIAGVTLSAQVGE